MAVASEKCLAGTKVLKKVCYLTYQKRHQSLCHLHSSCPTADQTRSFTTIWKTHTEVQSSGGPAKATAGPCTPRRSPSPALICTPLSGCLHPFPAEAANPKYLVSPHPSRGFRSQWLGQLHFLFSFQRGISLGGHLKEL